MNKIMRTVFATLLVGILAIGVYGCKKEGPMERTGREIDQATEKAGDKIEKTTDKAGDKIEKAGEKIKESVK